MSIVSHGACGTRWRQVGNRTGHCSGCHNTFASLAAFDRHHRDGKCIPLGDVALQDGSPAYELRSDGYTAVWHSAQKLDPSVFGGDQ